MVDLETKRQALHFITGVAFAAIVYYLPLEWAFAFLALGALSTFAIAGLIKSGRQIPVFSYIVRKTERKGKPPASGVTWYFLGVLFIFVVFVLWLGIQKEFVVASMLVVAIGDSVCTGLGRKIGKKKLPRTTTKSYRGSGLGFSLAFFAILYLFTTVLPLKWAIVVSFAGALVGMLAEAYLTMIDDNLTIPLLSCCAMVIAYSILLVI